MTTTQGSYEECGPGSYENADGTCVPTPASAPSPPPGATALCNNGEYSYSKNRSGTCSSNGGVARWL
ncbi:DUF3761 domain-containing protein [Nocardia sp. NPDC058705]|uniref:DUF3761 domain-containing protein n=1 Tax=Nocardia sp. NPDC058705 TaxID=3346609 RepID=UPI0036B7F430